MGLYFRGMPYFNNLGIAHEIHKKLNPTKVTYGMWSPIVTVTMVTVSIVTDDQIRLLRHGECIQCISN